MKKKAHVGKVQDVEKVKLKNGMEIIFIFDKRFVTSTVQINFKIGWRHDEPVHLGIAHLFEHLVGKRTGKYSGKSEFTAQLEKMGIESNAYTTPDYTSYYHDQTNENLLVSLGLLFEAIYNTKFVEEDLELEKKVVMNERRDHLDNDDNLLWKEMMHNLFPGTTLTRDLFGSPETMQNITLETFENFYKCYKNPKNSFLVVAASDKKLKTKVVKFLNDFYAKKSKAVVGEQLGNVYKPIAETGGKLIANSKIEKPDRKQCNLRVVYKIGKLSKRERMDFHVMGQILTGGFSGKIFKRLRDELGLTYSIRLWRDSMVGFQYAAFDCMCEKEKREELLQELDKLIKENSNKLTQQDVTDVLQMMLFREGKSQSPRGEAQAMTDAEVLGQEYFDSETYKKMLLSTKVGDIRQMMKSVFGSLNKSVLYLE